MALVALALSALLLTITYSGWEQEFPTMAHLRYPVMITLTATLVPYFIALYQTLHLLSYIDKGRAFSLLSVTALKKIKYSAIAFSGIYLIFQPIVYMVAQADDAPGIVIIGAAMVGAPIVVAVFASVLEKLLHSAIAIKSENDLTV